MKTDRERRLAEKESVRTLAVPVFPDRDDGSTFPLAYTDSGADGERPVLVVLPGGPRFASVAPYARTRPCIVRAGFRVVMVEHRGVGLSRRDGRGRDLPVEAMRVEYAARDVVAVLEHLRVEKAWVDSRHLLRRLPGAGHRGGRPREGGGDVPGLDDVLLGA